MLLAIFAVAAIAGLAWLLFASAVYAMPLTLGVYAAVYSYRTGAGVFGAGIIGIIVAGLVLGLGEFAFSRLRSRSARVLLALAYAVPAAIAGYWATHGIVKYLMPAAGWQIAFSLVGGAVTGFIAMARLASAPHVPIDASPGSSPSDSGYGSPDGLASSPGRLERAADGRGTRTRVAGRGRAAPWASPPGKHGRGRPRSRGVTHGFAVLGVIWTPLVHLHAPLPPATPAESLRCNIRHGSPPSRLAKARTTRPLDGLIWPKDGCASIA